jgi:hypothetical protein
MRYGKHSCNQAIKVIVQRVRESTQQTEVNFVLVLRPGVGICCQSIDLVEDLGTKGVSRQWTALEVPEERFSELSLSFRKNVDAEARHNEARRARASAQGTALVWPERSASRRRSSSRRQASVTD